MVRRSCKRSTSGCNTCKVRKVKCDENRPGCHRCTSTGRKCDGYANSPTRQVSIYNNRTQAQYQAFDFFIVQILPGMSHVIDTEFWDRSLLQVAQTDSTVWLAMTAMSELVRQWHGGDKRSKHAIEWYTRSINELQTRMKAEMKWSVICSVTSILYICIECLLNNESGALSIGQRAVQQMVSVRNDTVSTSIMPLLKHITVAHGFFVTALPRQNEHNAAVNVEDMFYELIGEAHQFVCYAEELRIGQPREWSYAPATFQQRSKILTKLEHWPEMDIHHNNRDTISWSCMELVRHNYLIWVSAILEGDKEMGFDKHLDGFGEMLRHAGIIIDNISHQLFSFETRVIPSLGYVAMRCRHPVIRRKAIVMLERGPQIENTRHAGSTVALAKRIIAIEESGYAKGTYREEPVTLDLPSNTNRLIYAKLGSRSNDWGRTESYLTFGRWRLQNDVWAEEFEITRV